MIASTADAERCFVDGSGSCAEGVALVPFVIVGMAVVRVWVVVMLWCVVRVT